MNYHQNGNKVLCSLTLQKVGSTNKQNLNNMNKTVEITPNGIQMSIVKNISFCNKQQHGSDFDIDRARCRCQEYAKSIIEAYVDTIISTLKRRMDACILHLELHVEDIEYADNCGHIVWKRKDGSCGQFNVKSYEAMEQAVKALKSGCFKEFLEKYTVSKRRKDAFKIIVDSYIELDQFEPARSYLTMMQGEFAGDDDIEKIVKKNEKNIASAEKDFEKRMKKDSKKKKEDKEDKEMTNQPYGFPGKKDSVSCIRAYGGIPCGNRKQHGHPRQFQNRPVFATGNFLSWL